MPQDGRKGDNKQNSNLKITKGSGFLMIDFYLILIQPSMAISDGEA